MSQPPKTNKIANINILTNFIQTYNHHELKNKKKVKFIINQNIKYCERMFNALQKTQDLITFIRNVEYAKVNYLSILSKVILCCHLLNLDFQKKEASKYMREFYSINLYLKIINTNRPSINRNFFKTLTDINDTKQKNAERLVNAIVKPNDYVLIGDFNQLLNKDKERRAFAKETEISKSQRNALKNNNMRTKIAKRIQPTVNTKRQRVIINKMTNRIKTIQNSRYNTNLKSKRIANVLAETDYILMRNGRKLTKRSQTEGNQYRYKVQNPDTFDFSKEYKIENSKEAMRKIKSSRPGIFQRGLNYMKTGSSSEALATRQAKQRQQGGKTLQQIKEKSKTIPVNWKPGLTNEQRKITHNQLKSGRAKTWGVVKQIKHAKEKNKKFGTQFGNGLIRGPKHHRQVLGKTLNPKPTKPTNPGILTKDIAEKTTEYNEKLKQYHKNMNTYKKSKAHLNRALSIRK